MSWILVKNTHFCCHKHSWKFSQDLLAGGKRDENTVLNRGHWLGSLLACNSTSIPSSFSCKTKKEQPSVELLIS